jgi:AraC-like DNA-binding protein
MTNFATPPTSIVQNRPAVSPEGLLDPAARRLAYQQILRAAVEATQAGSATLRVPRLRGLRRRRRGQPFHATPEIFLQQVGSTAFIMPIEQFELKAGEVCVMPRGVPHAENTQGPAEDYLTLIVMFQLDGFSLHFGRATARGMVDSQPLDRFPSSAAVAIQRYCDELAAACDGRESAHGPLARGLLLAILALLAREIDDSAVAPGPSHPQVRRCLDLLEANLGQTSLNVQWLASKMSCTPDHLSRLFRRQTGRKLIDVIHELRIGHAAELLSQGKLRIGEAAWASGFATQSYFNRVFRELRGVTPGEFQRQGTARPL